SGANGCSATSSPITITGSGTTQTPTVTASGPLKVCAGDSVVLTASAGFSGYHWSNGATTQSITVKVSGDYSVTVKTSSGCAGTSQVIHVSVEPHPYVSIIASGTNLCSGNA